MNPDYEIRLLKEWRDSPILFIKDIWGLEPQKKGEEFIRGKHITWQQTEILQAVERALRNESPKRISVVTGHGIGKTAVLCWLTHWFLFTRFNAQIGCTAPTSDLLFDVVWKEMAVWHQKLPEALFNNKPIKSYFEWTTTHYKITTAPQTWWARARTARKESPEAFAGLHGDSVMLLADEASGVPDEIYRTGEGSLTNKDVLVILTSNGTRLEGFYYDTHHEDKASWQCLSFDSRQSPIVEPGYAERILAKYGEDSDEARYMVYGQFPKEGGVLEGGWMPLLSEADLRFVLDIGNWRQPRLGVDPAGEGANKSSHILRDNFKAKVAALEAKSTPKSVAERCLTLATHFNVNPWNITVDNFGEGANVSQEVALATHQRIQAINVGDKADDEERYSNKRSENFWRMREWIIKGGQLIGKLEGWKDLLTIYYKRNLRGKIQIMSKDEMSKKGWESPDVADGLSLTFNKREDIKGNPISSVQEISAEDVMKIANMY